MTITVKPVERKRWYGNDKADFIISPIKLQCYVDNKTRKYVLGCTEEERVELENLTGFNLSLDFKTNEEHSFFDDELSHVSLKHGVNVFNLENPMDRLKIAILKGHPMVANSLNEYESRKNPVYKFIIINETEEDTLKANKRSVRRNAMLEMVKLTGEIKVDFLRILTGRDYDGAPLDLVDSKLEEQIDKDTAGFMNLLSLAQRDIKIQSFILKLINQRVFTKEGDIIYYGDLVIGATMTHAIEFFKQDKNKLLIKQLQEKVK